MQLQCLISVAVVLSNASGAFAQAASATSNPLGDFIGAAGSAVQIINSANAQQTATQQAPSTTPSTTSTPAASPHKSNSSRTLIITIVTCIVGSLLLIAALITCVCCCLARRRRRARKLGAVSTGDDEKTTLHPRVERPLNPGRTYAPAPPKNRVSSMGRQPTVSLLASSPSMPHHRTDRPQNPFVPPLPNPRRQFYSNNDGPTHVHPPITTITTTNTRNQPLHKPSPSPSRSRSSTIQTCTTPTTKTHNPSPLSGIGRPYEDMHVHVLQNDSPSQELRESLRNREPIQRYSTPPLVPSRSPRRRSNNFPVSPIYPSQSESSNSSGSGEEWRRSQLPAAHYHSRPDVLPPPPVPWDSQGHVRRNSGGSPRSLTSAGGPAWKGDRERQESAASRSNITGQQRRLRFPDLPATQPRESGNVAAPSNVWDEGRYSQQSEGSHVVGQAL